MHMRGISVSPELQNWPLQIEHSGSFGTQCKIQKEELRCNVVTCSVLKLLDTG